MTLCTTHFSPSSLVKCCVLHMYGMWQYNIIVSFLRIETKTEWPFLLYKTPHLFRRNGQMVLKRFIAEYNDHKMICRWIKQWRTIRALLHLLLRALLLLLLRWDVPLPTGDASLYFAGESTDNRHCLWMSSPEQCDNWGPSSESWCGHSVKVECATKPQSFHRRRSSAAQWGLSQLLSSLLVAWTGSSLHVICLPVHPQLVSYQALLS